MNEAYSKSWTKTSDASSDSDSVFSASQDDCTLHSREEKSLGNYALFNSLPNRPIPLS
jgi:hypothetical protein